MSTVEMIELCSRHQDVDAVYPDLGFSDSNVTDGQYIVLRMREQESLPEPEVTA